MARKEIKIFMDSKEVSNFLKVIDWSWLFTFLSERYKEDERSGEVDSLTGYYYVDI